MEIAEEKEPIIVDPPMIHATMKVLPTATKILSSKAVEEL